jgi:hypothetical protein
MDREFLSFFCKSEYRRTRRRLARKNGRRNARQVQVSLQWQGASVPSRGWVFWVGKRDPWSEVDLMPTRQ